jgi:hypothetical protein
LNRPSLLAGVLLKKFHDLVCFETGGISWVCTSAGVGDLLSLGTSEDAMEELRIVESINERLRDCETSMAMILIIERKLGKYPI